MLKRVRPKPTITRCDICTLRDEVYVPPWLPPSPELPVLWVGQGPGRTEGAVGVPFTGKAGKMLYSLMLHAGISKNKQRITNLIGCVAINEKGEDREPTILEVTCCKPRLIEEIQLTKPELIIAMGKPAMIHLTGQRSPIKDMRNQFFPLLPEFNHQCDVYVVLHPSFVMRQRQWIEIAVEDLKHIVNRVHNTTSYAPQITITNNSPHFNLSPTPTELSEYLVRSSQSMNTSFDLETCDPTGTDPKISLNPRRGAIRACGFSTGADAIVFHFDDWQFREVAKRFLEDPHAKKSTQNGSFDCAFLFNNGILVHGLEYDTRLAEHLLNADLPTDLQFLRKQYTTIPPYKRSRRDIKLGGGQVTDIECCWDAYTTNQVMQAQLRLLTSGHVGVLKDIYIPLIFTLNNMQQKGVKVNVPALQILYSRLQPIAEDIYKEYFAPKGLNPRSPKQLIKYWGLESSDNDTITALVKKNHPDRKMMQALLDYREIAVQASKVLKGTYKRLENGYVHTNYRPEGTGTGRISSSDPALQNVRREFRVIFIPDDPDHVLVQADYNQLELVVAALLGNEQNLLSQILQGIKPHHVLGKIIFGREWSELTEQERLREKAVLFGTMGGRGARSIAMEFGVPISVARDWQEKCVGAYPGLLSYQEDCLNEFKTTGKITTAFGTERKVSTVPQAMNNRFQGSASFVTLTTLNKLHDAGFDLRLTVHDSIIWQCLKKELRESVSEARKIIERPIPQLQNWQFRCKIEAGDNWYEMKEVS